MGINTLVKDGTITDIKVDVDILYVEAKKGVVHYNPGLARSPSGETYISIRSCDTNFKERFGITHPLGYENYLHLGILDEDTKKISGLKLIEPDGDIPGAQWGIEDVRLFWREDGLHGICVILPIEGGRVKLRLAEILIDYKKGTYSLVKDLGRPMGHAEKNWMPTEHANPHFDYLYSPTQIVKDGRVIGEDNELFIHNGTPLIHSPVENCYYTVAHVIANVENERTYAHLVLKVDLFGKVVEHSQLFHFNVGWREKLKETIEFASGLLWSKNGHLLVGLGVKDELTGLAEIPLEKLHFSPYQDTIWYSWGWETPPNRVEISAARPTLGSQTRQTRSDTLN